MKSDSNSYSTDIRVYDTEAYLLHEILHNNSKDKPSTDNISKLSMEWAKDN